MGKIQSVAELSDIRTTDHAFQTLQALANRYGVKTNYLDGPDKNRALTRFEFAAVLNQLLNKLLEAQDDIYSTQYNTVKEDVATLKRLQNVYGTITNDLATRLSSLDKQISGFEKRQFSTTTNLSGQLVGIATGGTRARITGVDRLRLDLNTSFSGRDLLLTQLEAGDNGQDAVGRAQNRRQNLLGTTGLLAGGGGLDYVEVPGAVTLSKLYYTIQAGAGFSFAIGPRLAPRDFIDANSFANGSDRNFSSSFFMNNPLIVQNQVDRPGGAGAVLTWKPDNLPLAFRGLYVAADAKNPNSSPVRGGLFGDRYQGSLELEYSLSKDIVTRFQFTRAAINNIDIFAGGINAEWAISRQFAVFGRYGIGSYSGFSTLLGRNLDLTPKRGRSGQLFVIL